jgi:signal transduction histidine kinase
MIVPLIAHDSALGVLSFLSAGSGRRFELEDLEIAEDLATRAALAIENSRLFDKSRAASEAKSDFLAVMSHELRTPLTAIIGFAELLQLGVPDPVTPRQHEQAERIEVSGRHLLQLIEEILTLVTLESGQRRVQRGNIDVNGLLRRATAIIEPMARSKGLELKLSTAEGDPVLRSDADKLLQILLNLLSNAVKFTETGEISLSACINDELLLIDVTDTGIGLDAEHLDRIFEPFWQVERPITRRAGGTGLGLTISRRLADLLGAELEVTSEIGKGSTFRVKLPA